MNKTYEYKELRYYFGTGPLTNFLNTEGEQGWEYCDRFDLIERQDKVGYRIILKRECSDNNNKQ